MTDVDLHRFVVAQAPVIDQVRAELRAGRKTSHWMWFVFPQLRALGRSATARHYGLADLAEARAYHAHPLLGPRLVECTVLMNQLQGMTATRILGSPDDLKFRSCMTLFAAIEAQPYRLAIDHYFGTADQSTLDLLHAG